MKTRRFFYHYFKAKNAMSVHFNGKCHIVSHVECRVPCETKWNKQQPMLVMRGFAHEVIIGAGGALII